MSPVCGELRIEPRDSYMLGKLSTKKATSLVQEESTYAHLPEQPCNGIAKLVYCTPPRSLYVHYSTCEQRAGGHTLENVPFLTSCIFSHLKYFAEDKSSGTDRCQCCLESMYVTTPRDFTCSRSIKHQVFFHPDERENILKSRRPGSER